jgi:hypothetical protein
MDTKQFSTLLNLCKIVVRQTDYMLRDIQTEAIGTTIASEVNKHVDSGLKLLQWIDASIELALMIAGKPEQHDYNDIPF